jgi:hypothetical protein
MFACVSLLQRCGAAPSRALDERTVVNFADRFNRSQHFVPHSGRSVRLTLPRTGHRLRRW